MKLKIEPSVQKAMKSVESIGCRIYLCDKSMRGLLFGNEPNHYTFALFSPENANDLEKALNPLADIGDICGIYHDASHFQSKRLLTADMPLIDKDGNVLDSFNGIGDIVRRTIRCVPGWDDELRHFPSEILRIIAMESEDGFAADITTHRAMASNAASILENVGSEPIRRYFSNTLLGSFAETAIIRNEIILSLIFKELSSCSTLQQNNPYTAGSLYIRMARAIGAAPKDLFVRAALFFLYTGFPSCCKRDVSGFDTFGKNAYLKSAEIARGYMEQLGYQKEETDYVCTLIANQATSPQDIDIRRFLKNHGTEQAQRLLDIQEADTIAQCRPDAEARLEKIAELRLTIYDTMHHI